MNHIIHTNESLLAEQWEKGHMPRRFRHEQPQPDIAGLPRRAVLGIAIIAATQLWVDAWVLVWLVRHIAPMVWP